MSKVILVINPGSTSTKLAIYKDKEKFVQENFEHDASEIAKIQSIPDQVPYRMSVIDEFLKNNDVNATSLDAIVGRGGMVAGIKGKGYKVNEDLKTALSDEAYSSPHASNLGGLLAKAYADTLNIPAYIYDAVTGGELPEIATLTGFKEITRTSACHLLNSHAMAVKYAESIGKKYEELNLIVAHLGGGCSVSAHRQGIMVDSVGDDDLHFSPERAGSTSLFKFMKLCFEEGATPAGIKKKIRGQGGMMSHLGTSDCREVEEMANNGNAKAKLVLQSFAMQIAKSISTMAVSLKGEVDAIILTGGVAYSKNITSDISQYVSFISDVAVLPGENEMEALAYGALRLLDGEEEPHIFELQK